MSLFKAADLLKEENITRTILLDCYKIPEGAEIPTLEITINNKTRKAFERSQQAYLIPKITQRIGRRRQQREVQIIPKQQFVPFIMDILKAETFQLDKELIDVPSLAAIESHLNRSSTAAMYWSNAICKVFEEEEHIKKEEEEEDEKN